MLQDAVLKLSFPGNDVHSAFFPEKMAAVDIDVPVNTDPQICISEDMER